MNDPLQTQFRLPGPDPLPAPKDPALPESRTPDLQFQTQPEDSTLPSIPKTLWGLSQESQGHSSSRQAAGPSPWQATHHHFSTLIPLQLDDQPLHTLSTLPHSPGWTSC